MALEAAAATVGTFEDDLVAAMRPLDTTEAAPGETLSFSFPDKTCGATDGLDGTGLLLATISFGGSGSLYSASATLCFDAVLTVDGKVPGANRNELSALSEQLAWIE